MSRESGILLWLNGIERGGSDRSLVSLMWMSRKDEEHLEREKFKFCFEDVVCLFQFSLDDVAWGIVPDELLEPSLAIEVDDRETAIGLKILVEVGKVPHPIFKVMIDIAGEDEIDGVIRQAGVIGLSQHDFDVLISFLLDSFGEVGIHLCIDIHGKDFSCRSHGIR